MGPQSVFIMDIKSLPLSLYSYYTIIKSLPLLKHSFSLSLSLSGFLFTMQSFTILPFLALLLLTVIAEDGHGQQVHMTSFPIQGRCNNPLLFVFGASMVDTGQYTAVLPYSTAADFPPYGLDYFSRPAGRWSNGRVITDFISKPLLELPF
mgnify:CR=1 FL=1